jgi:apolipoprotein D and lipocalin family protein
MKLRSILSLSLLTLLGCTGKPSSVEPVKAFDVKKYTGIWYEIARLDHSFERGLTDISASYSLDDDGSVKVVNTGWNSEDKSWHEAIGKAKFVAESDVGYLKVSFFGPFYGSYVIFYLEPDYSVSLVSGFDTDYFWILSRSATLPQEKLDHYVAIAQKAGFDTSKLIYSNDQKGQ